MAVSLVSGVIEISWKRDENGSRDANRPFADVATGAAAEPLPPFAGAAPPPLVSAAPVEADVNEAHTTSTFSCKALSMAWALR